MSHIIGRGRYLGETYPIPGGGGAPSLPGAIVQVAVDATTTREIYPVLGGATNLPRVRRNAVDPIALTLAGFTPGNGIAFFYSLLCQSNELNVGLIATLAPVISIGAGFKLIGKQTERAQVNIELQVGGVVFIQPAAIDVTADPVLGLAIWNQGGDQLAIPESTGVFAGSGSAVFVAMEVDAATVTGVTGATLQPYPHT